MVDFLDTHQLAQKRVLITGGTSGIGLATAIMLAKYGLRIYVIGRDEDKLEKALVQIKGDNEAVEVYGRSVDLTQPQEIKSLFESIEQQWGGLDILINNAAIGYGSIMEGEHHHWQHLVDTNVLAYLACCNYAAMLMRKQGQGHIINIGSMSADVRDNGSSLYVATKSALQGFSEAFRKEVNHEHIVVTLIEPGAVNTSMQESDEVEKAAKVEKMEMLESEDIARSILYVLAQPLRCAIVSLQIRPLKQLI